MFLKKVAALCLIIAALALIAFWCVPKSVVLVPSSKAGPGGKPGAGLGSSPRSPAAKQPKEQVPSTKSKPDRVKLAYKTGIRIDEPAFVAFNEWAEEYLNASGEAKGTLEQRGEELARVRRQKMADLIQSHPDRALELTFSRAQRLDLPVAVQDLLEQPVSTRGDLNVFGVLAAPGQSVAPVYRTAELNGTSFKAFVYGRRLGEPTLRNVALNGITLDNLLAVDENPIRVLGRDEVLRYKQGLPSGVDPLCQISGQPTGSLGEETIVEEAGEVFPLCSAAHATLMNEKSLAASGGTNFTITGTIVTANSAYTEGTKKLIFIRVDFSDLAGGPFDLPTATNVITGLNSFYTEMSFNKTGFYAPGKGSAITAVLRMPKTASYYGTNDPAILRTDARAAATKAGFNLNTFNFDVTCMGPVPGYKWAGLAYIGAPGAWIRDSGSSIGIPGHELGHNYGLNHANFWDTAGQSIIGPGANIEYGDKFDTMGNAAATYHHFNARYKNFLNWIPAAGVTNVTKSGVFRLYPHDDPTATGLRGIKIVRTTDTNYFLEFRNRYTGNRWLPNGIGVRWTGNDNRHSVLLDMTPGSTDGKDDSALLIGRTFSDFSIGVHITPIGKGGTTPESIDVVVNKGTFPDNLPPALVIETARTNTTVNSTLTFSATAGDPNGDTLAYFWNFGDGNFGGNAASGSHAWAAAGEYVVQCTASDMKGGTATASQLVRIGTPTTYRISGRITDGTKPIAGVQVSASSTRIAYTDSDGHFYITGLTSGSYTIKPVLAGYVFSRTGFANPVTVGPSKDTANFIAIASNDQTTTSLIPAGAIWEFLDDGSNQGTAWRALSFDDTIWNEGAAPLGYGDSNEKTVLHFGPDANNKYITTYFRREFLVDNKANVLGLTLGLRRDDGGVVYVNNKEVFRSNMPTGTIGYKTLASTTVGGADETAFFETELDPNVLVTGTNVVAVEIHQAAANSSDIVFDLRLLAITGSALPPPEISFALSNGMLRLSWPESSVQYHVFTTQDLAASTWVQATGTISLINGQRVLSVPLSATQGFYRLETGP